MQLEQIKKIKKKYEAKWLKLPSVIAVGIGVLDGGTMGIIVSVTGPDDHIRAVIPEEIDGVSIEIRLSGPIKAL